MSGWNIECDSCSTATWASQIQDLMQNHRDANGLFLCGSCGSNGHITRTYHNMQGRHEGPWALHLIGAVQPDWYDVNPDSIYQPFAFLTRDADDPESLGLWVRYYKDTRDEGPGGKLKFGDGPGGGPAFNPMDFVEIVAKLLKLGFLDRDRVLARLNPGS